MLKGDWEKEMQKAAKRIVLFFTMFVNLSCLDGKFCLFVCLSVITFSLSEYGII